MAAKDVLDVCRFGADATEEEARAELNRAKAAGFDTARTYLRQRYYRSVVEFPSREAAAAQLERIRALSPPARGAYLVSLASWCPDPDRRTEALVVCPG